MLLQVLRALERLATKFTFVGFQGHMNSDMRRNMVALDSGCAASTPSTSQAEVVGTFATNMDITQMVLQLSLLESVRSRIRAQEPHKEAGSSPKKEH